MSDFYLCSHGVACCGTCIRAVKTETNRLEGEITRYKSLAEKMREALEFSDLAINDWLHVYASEECGKDHVARSLSRIKERGGTLAYIAEVTMTNKQALDLYREEAK